MFFSLCGLFSWQMSLKLKAYPSVRSFLHKQKIQWSKWLRPVVNIEHEILAHFFLQFTYVSSVLTLKWSQNRVLINKKNLKRSGLFLYFVSSPLNQEGMPHSPQIHRSFLHLCFENPHLSTPRRKVADFYEVATKNKQVVCVTEEDVKTLAVLSVSIKSVLGVRHKDTIRGFPLAFAYWTLLHSTHG